MTTELTRRQQAVVAALAAESGARFAPVQVQKMFFLIDENVSPYLDGKLFHFSPYDYGPFDAAVYQELEALERLGLVFIENRHHRSMRRYGLTQTGQERGKAILGNIDPNVCEYIAEVSTWVRKLSFQELVGAIYKAYPSMRENSVFED